MIISDEDLLLEMDNRLKECKRKLDEQKDLSRELLLANKKLMESEALKTHFISRITNEIINPFSSILGLSRNLLIVKKEDWEKVKNMVRLINSEAFNLDFQFRNIFAAANIEAGQVFIESAKTNIVDLNNQIVESFRHEAEKKNINISVRQNMEFETFMTDSEKLKLIISNLISNAIKFNNENGSIVIKLESSGGKLIISILDTGFGINELEREVIFDRFIKGNDQINSINTGHGLGLSVVKSLVEILSGTLKVFSKQGKGCKFVLSIPESVTNTSVYNLLENTDDVAFGNNEVF